MNQALGNFDKTIYFTQPIEESPVNLWNSIGELAADIRAGKVSTMLIVGANPVYDAPADLDFRTLLPTVKFTARLGLYEDETSALCHWHIPQAHGLESWGDARAYDGTVTIIQPLIAPLYGGKSNCDFLAVLGGRAGKPSHDIVREFWQAGEERRGLRRFLGADAARWRNGRHDISSQAGFAQSGNRRPGASPPRRKELRLFFVPIRRSGTGNLQIMAGCRNCRSR